MSTDNPFKYATDPELNVIFDKLVALKTRVSAEFAKAEKIAGFSEDTTFLPLVECKVTFPSYQTEYQRLPIKGRLAKIEQSVREAIEAARTEIIRVENLNAPAIAKNKVIFEQVKEIMKRLGIGDTYSTYELPTSRSRIKRSVSHTAGYLQDLNRVMPKSNVDAVKYQVNDFERNFNSWVARTREAELAEMTKQDESAVQSLLMNKPRTAGALLRCEVNVFNELKNAVPGAKGQIVDFCMAKAYQYVYQLDKSAMLYHYMLRASSFRNARESLDELYLNYDFRTEFEKNLKTTIENALNNWDHTSWLNVKVNDNLQIIRGLIKDPVALALLEDLESNE